MPKTDHLPKDGNPGHKGGSGRPRDKFLEKCRSIVDKDKLIEYLADVASGRETETILKNCLNEKGQLYQQEVKIPIDTKYRIIAAQDLIDRGYGRAPVSLPPSGGAVGRFVVICE